MTPAKGLSLKPSSLIQIRRNRFFGDLKAGKDCNRKVNAIDPHSWVTSATVIFKPTQSRRKLTNTLALTMQNRLRNRLADNGLRRRHGRENLVLVTSRRSVLLDW